MHKKYNLIRANQDLAKNIVIIDGFSSSGKSLVAPMITYLERAELWRINHTYEYLAVLRYLNDISVESLKALLKLEADNDLYNLLIGRDVNFRLSDVTSAQYNEVGDIYSSRINNSNDCYKKILNTAPILPIHTHYLFGYTDALLKGFGDNLSLYLVTLRDPFYILDMWIKGGWVDSRCKRNRDFTLCLNYKNKEKIPWYTKEYADKFVNSNTIEKAILNINNYYTKVFSMYENLSDLEKHKVLFIVFEKFVENPDVYIDSICSELKTKRNILFNDLMKRLSLPRSSCKLTTYNIFSENYKNIVTEEYMNILFQLDNQYNKFIKHL